MTKNYMIEICCFPLLAAAIDLEFSTPLSGIYVVVGFLIFLSDGSELTFYHNREYSADGTMTSSKLSELLVKHGAK